MNKKIILIVVGVLVVLIGAYKFVLSPGEPATKEKPRITGVLLPLDKEFMVNLSGGGIAKLNVALLLSEKDPAAASAEAYAAAGSGPIPLHPQNAAIRATITSDLAGLSAEEMKNPAGRRALQREIKTDLDRNTDAKVQAVLFTDVVTDG